jgi:hypothetical protein
LARPVAQAGAPRHCIFRRGWGLCQGRSARRVPGFWVSGVRHAECIAGWLRLQVCRLRPKPAAAARLGCHRFATSRSRSNSPHLGRRRFSVPLCTARADCITLRLLESKIRLLRALPAGPKGGFPPDRAAFRGRPSWSCRAMVLPREGGADSSTSFAWISWGEYV